jgi:hypothetical protein
VYAVACGSGENGGDGSRAYHVVVLPLLVGVGWHRSGHFDFVHLRSTGIIVFSMC